MWQVLPSRTRWGVQTVVGPALPEELAVVVLSPYLLILVEELDPFARSRRGTLDTLARLPLDWSLC